MTPHQFGRTVLFMAPATEQDAEPSFATPPASDEVMRQLRNPFRAEQADGESHHRQR